MSIEPPWVWLVPGLGFSPRGLGTSRSLILPRRRLLSFFCVRFFLFHLSFLFSCIFFSIIVSSFFHCVLFVLFFCSFFLFHFLFFLASFGFISSLLSFYLVVILIFPQPRSLLLSLGVFSLLAQSLQGPCDQTRARTLHLHKIMLSWCGYGSIPT